VKEALQQYSSCGRLYTIVYVCWMQDTGTKRWLYMLFWMDWTSYNSYSQKGLSEDEEQTSVPLKPPTSRGQDRGVRAKVDAADLRNVWMDRSATTVHGQFDRNERHRGGHYRFNGQRGRGVYSRGGWGMTRPQKPRWPWRLPEEIQAIRAGYPILFSLYDI
jgi:hypothetical protein